MPGMFLLLLEAAVNKWKTLPETVTDLTGRTVIVTGSNVGLGLEAAKRFYAMNPARLILAVRIINKGEEARKAILEAGRRPSPHGDVRDETKVDVWQLDLSSFESVKQFANRCESEMERIDILLENAAVFNPGWSVTKDGWESESVPHSIRRAEVYSSLILPS
jgi:retinol dehydrogenase 12